MKVISILFAFQSSTLTFKFINVFCNLTTDMFMMLLLTHYNVKHILRTYLLTNAYYNDLRKIPLPFYCIKCKCLMIVKK